MNYEADLKQQYANAQAALYGVDAPRNSPFDSLPNAVTYLRDVEMMVAKLADRMVGSSLNKMATGASPSGTAVVPNLIDILEVNTSEIRMLSESIAAHVNRIQSRI